MASAWTQHGVHSSTGEEVSLCGAGVQKGGVSVCGTALTGGCLEKGSRSMV